MTGHDRAEALRKTFNDRLTSLCDKACRGDWEWLTVPEAERAAFEAAEELVATLRGRIRKAGKP